MKKTMAEPGATCSGHAYPFAETSVRDGGMPRRRPVVRLIGANGNAYMVLGLCFRAARKAGWSKAEQDEFKAKATSGDYNNLLAVVQDYFDVR